MSKYKKHHYVPESVLKNFISSSGEFFYFYKLRPDKPIIHRNPTSVFCQNYLYTFFDATGKKDNSVETDFFKQLDTLADPIIKTIVNSVRQGKLPSLSANEREIWDEFYIKQNSRNPEKIFSARIQENLDLTYEQSRSRLYESCAPHLKELLDDPEFKKRLQQETRVKALTTDLKVSKGVLQTRGLYFAKIVNTKKSFIIGSSPLVRLGNKGTNRLDDPKTELWYPIAYDVAVSIGSYDKPERMYLLEDQHVHTQMIRKINRIVLLQSFEIGGRSKALIESLTKSIRENYQA